ncbi:MAG TPA: stage V sporulation protein AD [Clostridiaceae bacterium]|nr:stage V sporulation protein AD [Clostridiaceae bacterium]
MANKNNGKQTIKFQSPVSIVASASIVGPKEGQGPLRSFFDSIIDDEMWGEKSWEKAESKIIRETYLKLLSKSDKQPQEINYIFSGDLLNQCIAANYGLRDSEVPFFGLYGACSTMAESLILGAMAVDGGFADNVICITSSHFCSAEKQFRFPLELGTQRPPTSQWTVTGSGGLLLSNMGSGPYITYATIGRMVDMGIKDANNMGAAMAPAAIDTIQTHFKDTGFDVDRYDLIITGDLGLVGSNICKDLLKEKGFDIGERHRDCGLMIFDLKKQDVHAGGSGCGCSATVLASYIMHELKEGNLNKILFVATGALHSTTSVQQGESIPGIAHAVSIEREFE